jgi:hypothetical protein
LLHDAAAPLAFDKQERQANITIEVAPDGLHIRCEYTGALGSIPQAIERLKAAGVLELVSASRPVAPTNGKVKRPEPIEPWYNDEGEACCPVHRKPLRDGDYGPYYYNAKFVRT